MEWRGRPLPESIGTLLQRNTYHYYGGDVPRALLALCCLFWPILALIQGAIAAYFSSMWTLAWRRWTGEAPAAGEPVAEEPITA